MSRRRDIGTDEDRWFRRAGRPAAVALLVCAVAWAAPLLWFVRTSLAPPDAATTTPAPLVFLPDTGAYAALAAYLPELVTSLALALGTTLAGVALATLAAYALSRLRVPFGGGLMFGFLATKLTPAVAMAVPLALAQRLLGLEGTGLVLALAYTGLTVSLAVWLLKSFLDEIPREYEEAAMMEGYTRWQAFRRVVLPRALPGMAVTAAFCLVFAWNEYTLALLLSAAPVRTAPSLVPDLLGAGGPSWPVLAAGVTVWCAPVLLLTLVVRRHIARGLSFGAARQ